jgi:hypothetical protein
VSLEQGLAATVEDFKRRLKGLALA